MRAVTIYFGVEGFSSSIFHPFNIGPDLILYAYLSKYLSTIIFPIVAPFFLLFDSTKAAATLG